MASSNSASPSSADAVSAPAAWLAVLVIALGGLAVALAASPYKVFDLDRFFVPKELALHVAALLLGVIAIGRRSRIVYGGVDLMLALFLAISAISAVVAQNHWLATRSLAITWSAFVVFWSVTAVVEGRSARRRLVIAVLVVAVLALVATAMAQAYGVDSSYFSTNRAPGGMSGNRNFTAHLAAVAVPLLLVAAVGARRRAATVLAACGLGVASAMLVLSRSRAAWVALAAAAVVVLPAVWRARGRWEIPGMRRRLAILVFVVVASVTAAVFTPNDLSWRSASPYLDTMKSVADYSAGSGHGRLVQYVNTFRLALHHPVLGVGPGNWAVEYPAEVKANDPSLDSSTGMTANPWPSSDWMAFVSERGLPAVAVFALALLLLLADGGRQMFTADRLDDYLRGLALTAIVIVTAVVGAFDAVLLIPAPAFLVFAILGALRTPPSRRSVVLSARGRQLLLGAVVAVGVAAAARSSLMLDAMRRYDQGDATIAAREDPGSYRIQMRLAQAAQERGRCDLVRLHASAALALYPHAPNPRALLAVCRRSAAR